MARPPGTSDDTYKPTDENRELVRDWYAAGIPMDRIALRLEISNATLRKHYKSDLDDCFDGMVSGMIKNLYQDALGGDKKDRELWLRTRGRLANTQPQQVILHTTQAHLEDFVNSRQGIDEGADDETI